MKQIKASEIKPGMTIRWDSGGITYQCKVGGLFPSITSGLVSVEAAGGGYIPLSRTQPVTVLSEPAPAQPEEPTEFGAKITVAGRRMIRRTDNPKELWAWQGEALNGDPALWSWGQLTGLGPVQLVPDQGWTTPDAPEVPDRIKEWPEDDHALRAFMWRDRYRWVWMWNAGYSKWECHNAAGDYLRTIVRPVCGPWTRVDDSLEQQEPVVPERIEEWDTWEDVPEGVVVGNPELNYQYRKASGKIEAISPINGGVWGETSLPLWTYPGPWERVSDA